MNEELKGLLTDVWSLSFAAKYEFYNATSAYERIWSKMRSLGWRESELNAASQHGTKVLLRGSVLSRIGGVISDAGAEKLADDLVEARKEVDKINDIVNAARNSNTNLARSLAGKPATDAEHAFDRFKYRIEDMLAAAWKARIEDPFNKGLEVDAESVRLVKYLSKHRENYQADVILAWLLNKNLLYTILETER